MAKIKLVFFLFCIFLNAQNKDIDIQHINELQKLGDSLFKASNYTEAAKLYKELVQIDPNSFDNKTITKQSNLLEFFNA